MKERIQKHIDELFTNAPKTRRAMELKEELTQNTIEKYEDLISEGYREEDAFQNVIGSIGDVTELFPDLEEKNLLTLSESDRRKKAILNAVSAGLYIFAGVAFFACLLIQSISPGLERGYGYFDYDLFGLVLAGFICIPATCIKVYAAHMYPSFHKKEDNLVENYKEAKHSANKEKAVKTSASALVWTLTVTCYFIISFATYEWAVTWITFLIGACVQAIVVLVLNLRRSE